MTIFHIIGAAIVLLIITTLGVYSGRKVKTSSDFSGGSKKAPAGIVAGSIIGTLVGGASTVGMAQLSFSFGFSAWWFTLGGGIGCLLLALVFCKPFYQSNVHTVPELLSREFGKKCGFAATLLTSMGSFLSIVSQVLSGIALVSSVVPIGPIAAAGIIIVLMLVYVVFGGVWGAGIVGMAKTVMMVLGLAICLITALLLQGGFGAFSSALPGNTYFNLLARGPVVDIGSGFSVLLGVLTTQTYIQAAMSAKSLRSSRAGCLVSALLIPLMGIPGIYVGMYMKLNFPDIRPALAMPLFVLNKTPPIAAGCIMAVLFVALVGTGAGVSLGLSTMITRDIYKIYINKNPSDKKVLFVSRMVIVVMLVIAAIFSIGDMGSLILGWSILSMALRAAVAFWPICFALFLPNRVPGNVALVSMFAGPVLVIIGKFILPPTFDSLFLGIAASLIILVAGLAAKKKSKRRGLPVS